MTSKKFVLMSMVFTVVSWALGVVLSVLAAYVYARIRGDLLPNGTVANGGPLAHWVNLNFRAFLPGFLLAGSCLGVAVGQAQLWIWLQWQKATRFDT